jgi:hypothetical protein
VSTARRAARGGRWARAAVVVAPIFLSVMVPLACATPSVLVGAGGECFVASDCAPGLVCVPQRGGARACSSDLSQVVGRPPGEAGTADAAADGDDEGSAPDAGGQDASVPDTSAPDTSVVDAADSG